MKKLLTLGLLLSSTALASAADNLPNLAPTFKAPVAAPCQVATATTPLSCSGAYVGVGLAGQGSNADIIGSGINGSVFAGGIVPSIDAGYQYVQGNWMFGAELDLGYSMNNNAVLNGVGNSYNGLRIGEVFKVGGNASALLGNQAPITIPPQLANAVIAPYVHITPVQWQVPGAWAAGTGSGAGAEVDFGPRIWGDLRYTYTDFHGAKAGGIQLQNDQSLRFSVNYKLN